MPYIDDCEETQGVYSKRLPDREGFFWMWSKNADTESIIEVIDSYGKLFWRCVNFISSRPVSKSSFNKNTYFSGPIKRPLKRYAKIKK